MISNRVGRMTVNESPALLNMVSITGVFLAVHEIYENTSEELKRTPKLTVPMTLGCRSLYERYCPSSLGLASNEKTCHP